MNIRKLLMLLGKCIIIFSILWPLPFGRIIYPWFGYKIGMPLDCEELSYWWPVSGLFVLGVVICLLSNYKTASPFSGFTPFIGFWKAILKVMGYGLLVIIAFYVVVLLVVMLYRILFTDMAEEALPILAAVGAFILLSWIGYRYYRMYKENNQ